MLFLSIVCPVVCDDDDTDFLLYLLVGAKVTVRAKYAASCVCACVCEEIDGGCARLMVVYCPKCIIARCCRALVQSFAYPRAGGVASYPDTAVVALPSGSDASPRPTPFMFAAGTLLGLGVTGCVKQCSLVCQLS